MTVAPVSADLLIKLALVAAGVGVLWYAYSKVSGVTVKAARQVADAAAVGLNPANQDNIVNRGVSSVGSAISGNANWNLGSWIYDVTHGTPDYSPAPALDMSSVPAYQF